MWFKVTGQQVELHIFAKPNAKRSEITGVSEQGLCVALHARPQDGEANAELIVFLSGLLKIPRSKIILRRGDSSRYKSILLPLTAEVQAFLAKFAEK